MKKRIVSLLLAAVLIIGLLPFHAFAGDGGNWENVTWGLSAGVLTISGTGPMPDAKLSWSKDGYLTDSTAPWFWLEFHTVIIDEGITTVGANSFFGTDGLETVQLPKTLTTIGESAFEGCIDLRSVNLPEKLYEISYYAFRGCESLAGLPLALPEGLGIIRDGAFYCCMGIKSVQFPASLRHLGFSAFAETGLMQIHIPATLTTVQDGAFCSCPDLEAITVAQDNPNYSSDDQGVLYNKDQTILKQVPGCFYGELTIPDTVTYLVDESVLWGCAQITKIHIPATMKEISTNLFYTCYSLEAIEVDDANPIYEDIIGVLYGPDSPYTNGFTGEPRRALICCPPAFQQESFFIPDDTEVLEGHAFWNCYYLQDVTIPDRVSSAPNGIFEGCTSLYEIHVDTGNPYFQSIDGVVFNKADVNASVFDYTGNVDDTQTFAAGEYLYCYPTGRDGYYAIPEGTKYLATDSFNGSALEAVRFPESMAYISMYAMADCAGLEWMLFAGSKPHVQPECFRGVTAEVHYPATNPTWEDDLQLDITGGDFSFVPWGPRPADEPRWPGHNPFTDVPADSFYYDPVLWALNNGITTGTTETTFNPNGQCLRAHVVTFLWRAAGCPEPNPKGMQVLRFVDVKPSDFYFKAVIWAVQEGITNGINEREFGPMEPCNRAQVVTFLYRAAGEPNIKNGRNPFTDVGIRDFYYKSVMWAVQNGITNGISATEFAPGQVCNRAQVVTFLYRAYN